MSTGLPCSFILIPESELKQLWGSSLFPWYDMQCTSFSKMYKWNHWKFSVLLIIYTSNCGTVVAVPYLCDSETVSLLEWDCSCTWKVHFVSSFIHKEIVTKVALLKILLYHINTSIIEYVPIKLSYSRRTVHFIKLIPVLLGFLVMNCLEALIN